MTNVIKNNIPNTVTCLNLFSGCIACVMAFEARYDLALLFIILSAVFDFFDGMLARVLNAHSIIGKDLDSLADDVSFGVAPSLIVFSLLKEMYYPASMEFIAPYLPYSQRCDWQSSTMIPARPVLSLASLFRQTLCSGVLSSWEHMTSWSPKTAILSTFFYWFVCFHGYWCQRYRCSR